MAGETWSELTLAAGDIEVFAGDPGGFLRCQEDRGWGDILRLADTAERCLCFELLAEIALGKSRGMHALGFDHAGVERVIYTPDFTLRGPNSLASALVIATTAALVPLYTELVAGA